MLWDEHRHDVRSNRAHAQSTVNDEATSATEARGHGEVARFVP